MNTVFVVDAVIRQIRRAHVNVPHGSNHALLQFDNSLWSHQHAARSALNVAGNSDRQVDAQ